MVSRVWEQVVQENSYDCVCNLIYSKLSGDVCYASMCMYIQSKHRLVQQGQEPSNLILEFKFNSTLEIKTGFSVKLDVALDCTCWSDVSSLWRLSTPIALPFFS